MASPTILSEEDRRKLEEALIWLGGRDPFGLKAGQIIEQVLESAPPTETEEDRELRRLAEAIPSGPWGTSINWSESKDGVVDPHGRHVIIHPIGCEINPDTRFSADIRIRVNPEHSAYTPEPIALAISSFMAACSRERILSLLDRLAGKEK